MRLIDDNGEQFFGTTAEFTNQARPEGPTSGSQAQFFRQQTELNL
jgi:hypothetical protein